MTMEMIVPLGGMLLFLTMSLVLFQGKGAILIAGYNTLSAEEKAKYDEAALCKATGKLMFGITFSMALIFVGEFFQQDWLLIVGIILMIAIIMGGIIHMNTGNRYAVQQSEKENKKETGQQ
ncbi:DUF3784 domain-containing protein [Planococcus maritimus]|nr:DUF3784 domain-containing protein [Planococcus sp. SK3692]MDE4084355.1 DUF3784 domain-containing protein [Planococcus maritimus]